MGMSTSDSPAPTPALTVDLQGLRCPLPVLRTKKALMQIKSGETLCIHSTDPGSVDDIPAFINQSGHSLVDVKKNSDSYRFIIKKR